jgi:hypothetical protein
MFCSHSCFLVLLFCIKTTKCLKPVKFSFSDVSFVFNSCDKNKHWKFTIKITVKFLINDVYQEVISKVQ